MDMIEGIKEFKVACILDEFSFQCFKYQCRLIRLMPENWKQTMHIEQPHLLFVESAWQGNGVWGDVSISKEVCILVDWCKQYNIPTVFWNKEDPYDFNRFIGCAKLFDYVFTTDMGSIEKYKKILGHNRVYILPFAAQTAIHNPIEVYEKRSEKACFAGTYYAFQFTERQKNLEVIFSVVQSYGLDIFDRHYGKKISKFAFPEKYERYIVGTLKGEEIIKAYKGYKISINLNSIKNSLTMFARRVFELLASNTIVVSAYSLGEEELLGDLTICSDNKEELERKLSKIVKDNLFYKKYRLLGLRKVLQYHTYKERFDYIAEKVLNIKLPDKWEQAAVVGFAHNYSELNQLIDTFLKQTYVKKVLYIFCSFNCADKGENNIYIYNVDFYKYRKLEDIIYEKYISFFHKEDFYGKNYLMDLMSTTLYINCDGFGKGTYYSAENGLKLCNEGKEYRYVKVLLYRNAMVKADIIKDKTAGELENILCSETINAPCLFSIDAFNYLYKGMVFPKEEYLKTVMDLENIDLGKTLSSIEKEFIKTEPADDFKENKEFKLDNTDTLIDEKYEKRKGNIIYEISIKKILIKNSKRTCLLLTNIYPSKEQLYQNVFVHRRVKNYLSENLEVQVFALGYCEKSEFLQYEYDGVKIYKGCKDDLRRLLNSGKYNIVLVHFVNSDMFQVLKDYMDRLKIIIWIHGYEAQPWQRRAFEYTKESDLTGVKYSSNKRMEFIKALLETRSPNIHFVFVSDIFRKEVEEDIGFALDKAKYSVIHNVIDTDLFKYFKKSVEQRKKILCIGPFVSRKYANDLKVKAILELSKNKIFKDLQFAIYGKGILFQETTAPLRSFSNVKLYEKFLTQQEIAALHREYGIFLTPTRWDSQGVSRDEAMAGGLVPITNRVAAIPEFVNENCGIQVEGEDFKGLAKAIEYLYHNPVEFLKKSENAAKYVNENSGKTVTVMREIKLINSI